MTTWMNTASELVVELKRHGAVCCCSSGAQGRGNQRAFGDFLARCAGGLRAFYCIEAHKAIQTLQSNAEESIKVAGAGRSHVKWTPESYG
ncbi:MAG: hypothetical protein ACRD4F_10845, partial [Candidatus Angelobacter sp.]